LIGGVIIFSKEHFTKVNGYSNEYWGWGIYFLTLLYIDDDNIMISKINQVAKMMICIIV
jgi:hypothetical protein